MKRNVYQKSLFGSTYEAKGKITELIQSKSKDYEEFVKKFDAKKTTDDCYTPAAVYDVVKDYVLTKFPYLKNYRVLRPFYPNGDFESEDYTNAVVIDNPPFSILAKIKRFYNSRNIPFFLFAPTLTLFSSDCGSTYIVTNTSIRYANGAKVNTAFVSNLFGSTKIILDGEFGERIKEANKIERNETLNKYRYPDCIVSGALMTKYITPTTYVEVDASECMWINKLDSHGSKRKIFGGGYMLGDDATERVVGDYRREMEMNEKSMVLELSPREKVIQKKLSKRDNMKVNK